MWRTIALLINVTSVVLVSNSEQVSIYAILLSVYGITNTLLVNRLPGNNIKKMNNGLLPLSATLDEANHFLIFLFFY